MNSKFIHKKILKNPANLLIENIKTYPINNKSESKSISKYLHFLLNI
jgi:hypothetical protein